MYKCIYGYIISLYNGGSCHVYINFVYQANGCRSNVERKNFFSNPAKPTAEAFKLDTTKDNALFYITGQYKYIHYNLSSIRSELKQENLKLSECLAKASRRIQMGKAATYAPICSLILQEGKGQR